MDYIFPRIQRIPSPPKPGQIGGSGPTPPVPSLLPFPLLNFVCLALYAKPARAACGAGGFPPPL